MYSTVLPQAFDSTHFDSPGYPENVHALLDAILDNVFVLVDSDNFLKSEIRRELEGLQPKYKMRFLEMWNRILRLRLLDVKTQKHNSCSSSEFRAAEARKIAMEIHGQYFLDSLISDSFPEEDTPLVGDLGRIVVPLQDYLFSEFERQRRELLRGSGPIDALPPKDAQELVFRCLRFSIGLTQAP